MSILKDRKIMKLDIREIPKTKSATKITTAQARKILGALDEYGIQAKVNKNTKNITVDGQDWEVREYMGKVKKYLRQEKRINAMREKYYIKDKYEQTHISKLTHKETVAKEKIKGLNNALKTQAKILDRSEGFSRIQLAAMDRDMNRKLAYEALHNSKEIMEQILKHDSESELKRNKQGEMISKEKDINYFMNEDGSFRSKKKEREYFQTFVEKVTTKYEEYEGQFYGYVDKMLSSTNDDGQKISGNSVFANLPQDEKKEFMREYIRHRVDIIEKMKEEGAEEAEEFDMDEESLELFKKGLDKVW